MKKLFYSIIFLVLAVAIFHYGDKLVHRATRLQEIVESSPTVSEIKKEVFTGGPLRGKENAPNARLTVAGVVNFANQERVKYGLSSLKENSILNSAAALKIKDMFEKQYFEHISPQGIGPADLVAQVGYEFIAVGENLALGNYKNDQALVQAWMNSPGHRANILNGKFSEIGVAVGRGTFEGQQVWLAVQEFAKPAGSCPKVDTSLKAQIDSYKTELDILEQQVTIQKTQLEQTKPRTKEENQEYNQKVTEYNNMVRIYNNKLDVIKQLTAHYNNQVQAYNACLGQ